MLVLKVSNQWVPTLLLLTLGVVIAGPAFSQCSTGAWSSESGFVQALGQTTSPQGHFYEGSCGLTVDASRKAMFMRRDGGAVADRVQER